MYLSVCLLMYPSTHKLPIVSISESIDTISHSQELCVLCFRNPGSNINLHQHSLDFLLSIHPFITSTYLVSKRISIRLIECPAFLHFHRHLILKSLSIWFLNCKFYSSVYSCSHYSLGHGK